jgi:glutathione S-transferase
MPNLSPFCAKLETYFRFRGIPYDLRAADMRKAPKGKIPYVTLEDGRVMGDSQLVIEHLEEQQGPGLDAHLSPQDRALGRVVQRMLDEAYYFVGVHLRWGTDAAAAVLRPEFVKVMPSFLRVAFPLVVRHVRKSLRAQGTGRHSPAEVEDIGKRDWDAISVLLSDKPYLLGDAPTTVDCSLYAFVVGSSRFPHESPLKAHLEAKNNLMAYRERIRARYYADL